MKEKEIEKVNQYFLKENMVDALKILEKLDKEEVKTLLEGLEKKNALKILDGRIKSKDVDWYDNMEDMYMK